MKSIWGGLAYKAPRNLTDFQQTAIEEVFLTFIGKRGIDSTEINLDCKTGAGLIYLYII